MKEEGSVRELGGESGRRKGVGVGTSLQLYNYVVLYRWTLAVMCSKHICWEWKAIIISGWVSHYGIVSWRIWSNV